MYQSNQRYHKHNILLRFAIIAIVIILITLTVVWWIFFKDSEKASSNFEKSGTVTISRPDTKEFTTPFFKIYLPNMWIDKGRQNPFSDQVYYSYVSTEKNYENRLLKVYVDIFPSDLPLNRLLPVTVVSGKLSPGVISDNCRSFTDDSAEGANVQKGTLATAKWQGASFTCNFAADQNITGTASAEEGYGVTMTGPKGVPHKYFFTYTDLNVRPDSQFLSEAIKSFQPL